MKAETGFPDARAMDESDPLRRFRSLFHLPPGRIYLDGNSLGPLCRPAEERARALLDQWRDMGIDGWNEAAPSWHTLAEETAAAMAPLFGAAPDEIAIANSTTVNLHQLLATLYHPRGRRRKILADALAFPSDLYAIRSQIQLHGLNPAENLVLAPAQDGRTLEEDDIIAAMTDEVHTAVLPSVLYTSGQLLDIPRLAAAARERGILLGIDCSHSAGVLPHQLSAWGVDFAFWCGYKYLNGGPGGIAGLFLNRRHFGRAPGLAGWWGSDRVKQFEMSRELQPAHGAAALHIGTPSILSLALLSGALELHLEAGIQAIRAKSLRQTEFLMERAENQLARFDLRIVTPRAPERRGGHVALAHPEARGICLALKREGVIADFRPPDMIRLCPAPLYTSYQECADALLRLQRILDAGAHRDASPPRGMVP